MMSKAYQALASMYETDNPGRFDAVHQDIIGYLLEGFRQIETDLPGGEISHLAFALAVRKVRDLMQEAEGAVAAAAAD